MRGLLLFATLSAAGVMTAGCSRTTVGVGGDAAVDAVGTDAFGTDVTGSCEMGVPCDAPVRVDVTPTLDGPPGRDVPSPPDAPVGSDVPLGFDVPIGPDVLLPRDVPFVRDAPFALDVPLRFDVPFRIDVTPLPDVTPGSIVGAYRLVAYDTPDGDGGMIHVTDVNTPVESGGVTYDIRGNGLLIIATNRIAESVAFLANDHSYADDTAADYASSSGMYGFAVPGALTGTTFTFFGMSITFEQNADGTIAQVDASAGTRITWAPTAIVPGRTSISLEGQAQKWRSSSSAPLATPRVALAWDRPGSAGGVITDNDSPISFGPFATATYRIAVTSPPAGAIGALGGTSIAMGYPIVYDDTNHTGAYEPGVDTLRGVASLAVAWRSGAASLAFDRSGVRELQEGLQIAAVHADYATARLGATPFDPATVMPPDLAVDIAPTGVTIPDIVR